MTYLRLCTALLAVGLGGCGLISSDVTNFTLKTQDKTFTVDTTRWNVNQTAADAYLTQSCASAPAECAQWVQGACTMNCSGSCDTTTQMCDLDLDISIYQPIDINADNPELSKTAKEPVIKVAIDSVTYSVTDNSLDVATPEMTIYVAPMSVMSPTDPSALAVGTIPAVPAMTTVGATDMVFTADGKQNLVTIMGNYMTPFNVIVGSTVVIKSGQPVPSGKLTANVHIAAHAGL
jgi:hypothetical protein